MHPKVSPLLSGTKVIPVLVIENPDDAQPLGQCLVDNGLPVLEVTLRSDAAFKAIENIANKVEGAVIGVGSILTEMQLNSAQSAGGWFGDSPGVSERLLRALELSDWPFLPGAGSLSEILALREVGFSEQKLFPAEVSGGVSMLKSIAGPVKDVAFCPTGDVSSANASEYLKQPNVFAIGGSWIAPPRTDLCPRLDRDRPPGTRGCRDHRHAMADGGLTTSPPAHALTAGPGILLPTLLLALFLVRSHLPPQTRQGLLPFPNWTVSVIYHSITAKSI